MKKQMIPFFFILFTLNADPFNRDKSGADQPNLVTASKEKSFKNSGGDHRCFKTHNPRNIKDLNCLSPEQMAAQVLATFMQQTPPPNFSWRNSLQKINE